ncbi:hypothetical protein Tco_0901282, partial [Tanacetum coccineum]
NAWTGCAEMAMTAFESKYIDKDTYSASAEDIKVQSYFLDDQLTNLSSPRNCMPPVCTVYVISSSPGPSDLNLKKKVRSMKPFENPLDTRKLESLSYHALGACLSLYNAFFRR